MELAERHGLIIIEDAAEATVQSTKAGSAEVSGISPVFLFRKQDRHYREGGMALTNDDRLLRGCGHTETFAFRISSVFSMRR